MKNKVNRRVVKKNPVKVDLRGGVRRFLPFIYWLLILVLMLYGMFADPWKSIPSGAMFSVIILLSGFRLAYLANKIARRKGEEKMFVEALEFGLLSISVMYMLIYAGHGIESPLYPILYLLMALLAAFNAPIMLAILLVYAFALEFSMPYFNGQAVTDYKPLFIHSGMLLLFAAIHNLLLRAYLQVQRSHTRVELVRTLDKIEQEARNFRLFKGNKPVTVEEHRRTQDVATYFEMHGLLQDQLKVLWATMHANTCAVFWYDEESNVLSLTEAYPADRHLREGDLLEGNSVFQGVMKQKVPVRVLCDDPKKNITNYYRAPERMYTMCVVPVLDGEKVRGLLCADRRQELEFSDAELKVMEVTADIIHKTMVNESLLRDLDQSQNEYLNLAESSKAIAKTLDRDEILKVSLTTTQKIAAYDFGAIVLAHAAEGEFEVMASWPKEMGLNGGRFLMGNSLVDWVVRKNQLLVNHDFDRLPKRPIIFTSGEKLRDVGSLLILPLNSSGQTIGAFVLISQKSRFFDDELQRIFQILANQIAVSLENAEIYKQKEQMAITDSLTGLYNRRFFKERMEEMVSRSGRYQKQLAVMMFDIDHFKNINDTYGHPVGDVVLKKVAQILQDSMRKIDLVARYGGEEFVLILDSVDEESSKRKSEEIRELIAGVNMESALGNFKITASVGISMYPGDASTDVELIEKADEALYASKRNGRDRSTVYSEIK